jgi:hypothetical protein
MELCSLNDRDSQEHGYAVSRNACRIHLILYYGRMKKERQTVVHSGISKRIQSHVELKLNI